EREAVGAVLPVEVGPRLEDPELGGAAALGAAHLHRRPDLAVLRRGPDDGEGDPAASVDGLVARDEQLAPDAARLVGERERRALGARDRPRADERDRDAALLDRMDREILAR